ncbi:MAG: TIGR01777 family protein [Myxococcales bacterium]|nr:MAG: TIGR01777 family protein [Myxococcales bacterium]
MLGRRAPDPRLDPRAEAVRWTPEQPGDWYGAIDGSEAVIHLAGEPVIGKRWSPEQKDVIYRSRVESTRQVVAAMGAAKERPRVFVCASAVGYYGDHPAGEPVDESQGPGQGFLADVVRDWEAAADEATALGVRVVKLRIGLVLGHNGGMLESMLPAFRMFVGGPVGPGDQMMPWIHIDDVVGLVDLALASDQASGPMNATAPHPVTMNEFARALGHALGRPSAVPVPTAAVKLLLGEAGEAVVQGQAAVPRVAQRLGYAFRFERLEAALADLFRRGRG